MKRTRCFGLAAAALALFLFVSGGQACFEGAEEFGSLFTIPVAWCDYDNDGDLDLAVGNFNQANQLFINQGNGSFTAENQFGAGATFAVVWADFDNDGDKDLAVGNGYAQQNRLYVNNGDLSFSPVSEFGTSRTNAMAWADFDLDGDLDLAVGNGLLGIVEQNYLYVNNGVGGFDQVAQFGTGQTATLAWGDFDNDGDLDLAAGNGGFNHEGQNYLYINRGDTTFDERPEFGGLDTASLAWGDCDNDGDLDLAVGNWNNGQNYLYRNNGDGTFNQEPQFGVRDPNTVAWGDFDNDGDLDLAVGNGDFDGPDSNYLYVNDGTGSFTEVAAFGLGSTDAVAWGDYDGDGDLDMAIGNEHSPPQNELHTNCVNEPAYLGVRLVGNYHTMGAGYSNRDAIGAKVYVYETGSIGDPTRLLGYREISAHGGFSSQNQIEAHFGLIGHSTADVRVVWPGSAGARILQEIEGVGVGQTLEIEETGIPAGVSDPTLHPIDQGWLKIAPNPMRTGTRIELTGRSRLSDSIEIHDLTGRLVRTLAARQGGTDRRPIVEWDGRTNTGSMAPAGVYLVRTTDAGTSFQGRILLIR